MSQQSQLRRGRERVSFETNVVLWCPDHCVGTDKLSEIAWCTSFPVQVMCRFKDIIVTIFPLPSICVLGSLLCNNLCSYNVKPL